MIMIINYSSAVLLATTFLVSDFLGSHGLPSYRCQYYSQPIDHFDFALTQTFRQRYLVVDEFWKSDGGPIFFYPGNEGDIVWFFNNTGQLFDWAHDFEALVVFAEHRYYGESLPFGNLSFQGLKRVGFLSSSQALADYVTLINYIKTSTTGADNSPVIAFGGSYGGMLAAWLRMKYPHVVIGSLASSAPIWLFSNLTPCGRYNEIVTNAFRSQSSSCVENIRKSWGVISNMAETGSGRAALSQLFGLCDSLKSKEEVSQLKSWLAETWSNLAMVNYPYAADFLEHLPAWPVSVSCSHLSTLFTSDSDLIRHLRDAVGVYYNFTGKTRCFNTSQTAVASLQERGWEFQQCTEMVMPICSDGVQDMFELKTWNITEVIEYCRSTWNVTPQPNWIVEQYGGKNILSASNIIFSNGELDPWSAGGVLTDVSTTLTAIVIEKAAHHLDLRSSRSDDIPSVIVARRKERTIIQTWISQHWKDVRKRAVSVHSHTWWVCKDMFDRGVGVLFLRVTLDSLLIFLTIFLCFIFLFASIKYTCSGMYGVFRLV